MTGRPGRCPVCGASFRGQPDCPRCGGDLRPLMSLATRAYHLRRTARQAIVSGDFERGGAAAASAQAICFTPAGEKLRLLASWAAGEGEPFGGGIARRRQRGESDRGDDCSEIA